MTRTQINALTTTIWIGAVTFLLLIYVVLTSDAVRLHSVFIPMLFQLVSWAAALTLRVTARGKGKLRISDPCVLFLALSLLYFLYPSIAWCRGEALPFGEYLTFQNAAMLFWGHGVFMLGVVLGYTAVSSRVQVAHSLDLAQLPSAWLPILLVIVVEFAQYIALNGGISPTVTYARAWETEYRHLLAARSAGGIQYLLAQVSNHAQMYLIILQGLGGGLLLSRTTAARRRQWIAALVIGLLLVFGLVVSPGGRSSAIIAMVISLVIADTLAGPLPRKTIMPLVVFAMVLFPFFALYRTHTGESFIGRLGAVYEEYRNSSGDGGSLANYGEFTGMLSKEAAVVNLTDSDPEFADRNYLLRSTMSVIPSQLFPRKLEWRFTSDVLSTILLGDQTVKTTNAGVAGAVVGDGYRSGGILGIVAIALLLGSVYGIAQRWLMADVREGLQGPALLKCALVAGFYGFIVYVIRGGLGEILGILLYNVIVPWLVLSVTLKGTRIGRAWLAPLPSARVVNRALRT